MLDQRDYYIAEARKRKIAGGKKSGQVRRGEDRPADGLSSLEKGKAVELMAKDGPAGRDSIQRAKYILDNDRWERGETFPGRRRLEER